MTDINTSRGASTADYYLDRAMDAIDERFGKGFSKKPAAFPLIAAFMHSAATDAAATFLAQQVRGGLEKD